MTGTTSPLGNAIQACLKSKDAVFRRIAVERLRSAFEATDNNREAVAETLGVSWRTLMRWLQDEKLRKELGLPQAK